MPKSVKALVILSSKIKLVFGHGKRVLSKLKKFGTRTTFANMLMFSFILFTSIGSGLIFVPAGLIVAGISCGIFGFLLGAE